MSMMRCKKCSELIDTDDNVECWVETKYEDYALCPPCMDDHIEKQEAMERAAGIAEERASL